MSQILWSTPFGVRRIEIMNWGMAWRTDLVRTRWPAKLRVLWVQCWQRFSRLASVFSQWIFCQGLSVSRIPRYLEGRLHLLNPRILDRFFWTARCMLKKNMEDLERFSSIPKARLKRLRMLLKPRASLTEGMPWSIVSSTNYWWVVIGHEGRWWSFWAKERN